ncbi:MAG: PEP-CTERM sorting domain-containing protein [Phycisphaerales bacterium JB064]
MKRTMTLLAIAAASPVALGQLYGWEISVDDPTLGPLGSGFPQSTTITVSAKFDDSVDFAFATGLFDLVAADPLGPGVAGVNWTANGLLTPFDFSGTSDGVLTGTGAMGVQPGQLHAPFAGSIGVSANPVAVWTIDYTATDFSLDRVIPLDTVTDPGSKGFWVYSSAAGSGSRQIDVGSLMEGAGMIRVVPAPATLGLMGLALVGISVRRRRIAPC